MSATEASRLLIDVSSLRRSLIGVVLFYFDFAFPAGALRLPAFLLPALRVPFRPGHGRPGFRRFGLDLARRHGPAFPVDVEDDAVRVLELALDDVVVRVAEIEEEFPAGLLDPFLLLLEVVALQDEMVGPDLFEPA